MKRKIIILLIFVIVLANFAYADIQRVDFVNGESFLFDGKNISLVDSSADSIIICVNGQKTIISDEKTVNGVIISVSDSDEGTARLRLDYECRDDCSCDGNECRNNACFTFA